MQKKAIKQKEESLSSDEEKPFQGKYHGRLRKRKDSHEEMANNKKPQYKNKIITQKTAFWMTHVAQVQRCMPQCHIYNFHNILAINEHSLMDPNCEESFLTSKFYMKRINKVSIENGCLLLGMEDIQTDSLPVPYICERLKSMGDMQFLKLAEMIESLDMTFPDIKNKYVQRQAQVQRSLPKFVEEMGDKSFFSQFCPNLLVISNSFLKLIGYEMEEVAIESVKYKTILKEFFSAGSYCPIIKKHLQNIELMKEYLEGRLELEDFCSQSQIVCSDYIYNRYNKRIKCKIYGGASRQLTPYIEIKEVVTDHDDIYFPSERFLAHRNQIEEIKDTYKEKEISLLKKLTNVPKQLDPTNKCRICSYKKIGEHSNSSQQI